MSARAATARWQPDGSGITAGGDVGGDIQAADAHETRFLNPGLPRAAITVWAYPVVLNPDTQFNPDTGPYKIEVQTEYTICDDPRHPGDTEEWADARYATEPGQYEHLTAAVTAARHVAAEFASGSRALDWDGGYF